MRTVKSMETESRMVVMGQGREWGENGEGTGRECSRVWVSVWEDESPVDKGL